MRRRDYVATLMLQKWKSLTSRKFSSKTAESTNRKFLTARSVIALMTRRRVPAARDDSSRARRPAYACSNARNDVAATFIDDPDASRARSASVIEHEFRVKARWWFRRRMMLRRRRARSERVVFGSNAEVSEVGDADAVDAE
jgi:hypothetical protein